VNTVQDRVVEKMDFVYQNLHSWLTSIEGLKGNHLSPVVHENDSPSSAFYNRRSHHWVILGDEMWKRAELNLFEDKEDNPRLRWMNIREFQRDIQAWIRLWDNCHFKLPTALYPVRLESMITLLINSLHACKGMCEVALHDVNEKCMGLWVRLKQYPGEYSVLVTLPIYEQ
jgi:hypothetical protein